MTKKKANEIIFLVIIQQYEKHSPPTPFLCHNLRQHFSIYLCRAFKTLSYGTFLRWRQAEVRFVKNNQTSSIRISFKGTLIIQTEVVNFSSTW